MSDAEAAAAGSTGERSPARKEKGGFNKSQYKRVRPELPDNVILVNGNGPSRSATQIVRMATNKLTGEDPLSSIIIKGHGPAITSLVTAVEVIKRRVAGLHQISKVVKETIVDTFEPKDKESDLETVTKETVVYTFQVCLSKDTLDTAELGYQAPLPEEEVKEGGGANLLKPPQRDSASGRGSGRGRGGAGRGTAASGRGSSRGRGGGRGGEGSGRGGASGRGREVSESPRSGRGGRGGGGRGKESGRGADSGRGSGRGGGGGGRRRGGEKDVSTSPPRKREAAQPKKKKDLPQPRGGKDWGPPPPKGKGKGKGGKKGYYDDLDDFVKGKGPKGKGMLKGKGKGKGKDADYYDYDDTPPRRSYPDEPYYEQYPPRRSDPYDDSRRPPARGGKKGKGDYGDFDEPRGYGGGRDYGFDDRRRGGGGGDFYRDSPRGGGRPSRYYDQH